MKYEPAPTVTFSLSPSSSQRTHLEDLLRAFENACATVRKVAATHHVRHQAALHALAYRSLCPDRGRTGLPAQYAIRALSRVSHQLRAEALGLADPYPERSFDLDARCASLEPALQALALSSLDCRALRGKAAQLARLRIPASFPPDLGPTTQAILLGATLVLPNRQKPYLLARYEVDDSL